MSQRLKNKLTGLLPADQQPTAQEQLSKLQTWETHVVVPLVGNVLGGVGALVLCGVAWLAIAAMMGDTADYADLLFWCGLAGGAAFGAMSIVRFLGDDLGFLTAAYRAGVASADSQISGLTAENESLHTAIRELKGQAPTHRATEMIEKIERAQKDAESLLSLAHAGQPISREKVSQTIPQRSWERAIQLMRAAGTLSPDGALTERNLGLSLKRLRAYAEQDRERAQSGTWRPKWFVEAKH